MFRVQRTDSTLCKYTMQGCLRIAVHRQDHDRAHDVPRCIEFLEFIFMNKLQRNLFRRNIHDPFRNQVVH
jgi:hypothetical protein